MSSKTTLFAERVLLRFRSSVYEIVVDRVAFLSKMMAIDSPTVGRNSAALGLIDQEVLMAMDGLWDLRLNCRRWS